MLSLLACDSVALPAGGLDNTIETGVTQADGVHHRETQKGRVVEDRVGAATSHRRCSGDQLNWKRVQARAVWW